MKVVIARGTHSTCSNADESGPKVLGASLQRPCRTVGECSTAHSEDRVLGSGAITLHGS